jgi:hypothetical protein
MPLSNASGGATIVLLSVRATSLAAGIYTGRIL